MSDDSDFSDLIDDCLNDIPTSEQHPNSTKRDIKSEVGIFDQKLKHNISDDMGSDIDLDDVLDDLDNVNISYQNNLPDKFEALNLLPIEERLRWKSIIEEDSKIMNQIKHLPLSRSYTNTPSSFLQFKTLDHLFLFILSHSLSDSNIHIKEFTSKPSKELIQSYGILLEEMLNMNKQRFKNQSTMNHSN